MIKFLEGLENAIKKYSREDVVLTLTKHCWETFRTHTGQLEKKESKNLSEADRYFSTCTPWLCYIAIAKGNNISAASLIESEYQSWAVKMWQFIEKIIDPREKYCIGLIGPFIFNLTELVDEFSKHLEFKEKNRGKKQETNHIQGLYFLTHDEKVAIFPTLTFVSDIKNKNNEISLQYSPLLHINFIRSSLLTNKLIEKTKNKNYLENFIKDLGFSSLSIFHELFLTVFILFINNYGIIDINNLPNDFDNSKKKFLVKILDIISHNRENIELSYEGFKDRLFNKRTLLEAENLFYNKPVYKSITKGKTEYICPSPYILLVSMGETFFSLLHQYNQQILQSCSEDQKEKYEKETRTIEATIGDVHEQYINDILCHYLGVDNFRQLTFAEKIKTFNAFEPGNDPSAADFLIETDNYIFIIECKNSIGLRDHFYKEYTHPEQPHPLFGSWNRIAKSLHQCSSTISNLKTTNGKKVFSLVVINETILGEAAPFGMYSHYSKFFENLNIQFGQFSLISLPQFEYLIASHSLEIFAQSCENNAKQFYNPDNKEINFKEEMCKVLNVLFEPYPNQKFDPSFWNKEYQAYLTP